MSASNSRLVKQWQRGIVQQSSCSPNAGRVAKRGEPDASEAVACLQMVIEERQRPVGRERGEPERQTGELHGHRVDVDAEQASLGESAPRGHSFGLAEISRPASAASNERRLVRVCEIATGSHEKRTASDCRSTTRSRRICSGVASRTSGANVRRTR